MMETLHLTRDLAQAFVVARRTIVGGALLLAAGGGGGEALAQTPPCLTPSMPVVGPLRTAPHGDFSLLVQIPEPGVTYHAHEFRYRLVDAGDDADEEWWETLKIDRAGGVNPRLRRFQRQLPEIPTSGANPGLFEAQVRRFCDEVTHSDWSDTGVGNVSRPPYFRERMSTDPLGAEYVCRFAEGQTRAGADGRGCRLYGNDRDFPTSATSTGLVLEIEDEHDGNLFRAERDTLVGTDDPPSAALGNVSDDDVQESLGHIWLVTFRMAPDFEDEQRPDHMYRVPLTLVDVYGVRSETLALRVQVQDVDEPDTWAFAPEPRVGAAAAPTVTEGDETWDRSYVWQRSPDVTPRQWEPIPDTTGDPYVPVVTDEGQWLRATVRYTDVGGAQSAAVPASRVLANLPPTFDATVHGTRTILEHARPGTPVGDPIVATDTAGDTLNYALVGDTAATFTIDSMTGQLMVSAGARLDFETEPVVPVTVQATDRVGETATLPVSVTLTDVREDGTITIAGDARVGEELVPRLLEEDGTYGVFNDDPDPVLLNPDNSPATILWQWQVSMDAGTTWRDVPDGGQRKYVPLPAHAGHRLRVLALYNSPEEPALREMAVGVVATPVATVPVIESVAIVSTPDPVAGYTYSDPIEVGVTFSEAVTVTGTLGIELVFDGRVRRVATVTDDGMLAPQMTWRLAYELVPGDPPASNIGVPAGTLTLTATGMVRNPSGRNAVLVHPTGVSVAQPVRTLMPDIPDVNQDGRLEAVDGLALYYAAAWRAALGADPDTPEDGRATLRGTYLRPLLAANVEPTDAELRTLLHSADIMLTHSEPFNSDLNQNGVVDGADALILYYALAFPDLLGDGTDTFAVSGFAHFRRVLLASLWPGEEAPGDSDFQQLLARVHQLIP